MRMLLVVTLFIAALLSFAASTVEGQVYIPLVGNGQTTVSSTPTSINTPTSTSTAIVIGTATNTLMPTITPTPTGTSTTGSTPTRTNTPTATATQVSTGITVLDTHSTYVDSIDYLHVVGEARNDTGSTARFVKVTANLFNAQGQLVNTEFSFVRLDVLTPGESSCFEVTFSGQPTWSSYQFETDYSAATEGPRPISLFNHSGTYHATFDDWYEVVGQARNDGIQAEEYVKIVGTLYGSNAKVIECDFTFTSADTLTPGQTSAWKITFTHAPPGAVGSYRVQVD